MAVQYINMNGRIIGEIRNGVTTDYVSDADGNVIALVDSNGHVTDTVEYYPFGEVAARTGTSVMPFQYRGALGYYTDQPSGRVYVRARHYRSDLARWQTVDPEWPDERAYAYVDNNPITKDDRSGFGQDPLLPTLMNAGGGHPWRPCTLDERIHCAWTCMQNRAYFAGCYHFTKGIPMGTWCYCKGVVPWIQVIQCVSFMFGCIWQSGGPTLGNIVNCYIDARSAKACP